MFFKGGNATSCKEIVRHPIKGTSRLKSQLLLVIDHEVTPHYGNYHLFVNKSGMRQAQGDFWNNPTGVIRTRSPAPFRFTRRSNPSLRQSPLSIIQSLKDLFFASRCKVKPSLRNLFAQLDIFNKKTVFLFWTQKYSHNIPLPSKTKKQALFLTCF